MTEFGPKDIYFQGHLQTTVGWYRSMMPALYLGADWNGTSQYNNHLVVIVQQPTTPEDVDLIKEFQRQGSKVIVETDDFIHGVWLQKSHLNKNAFTDDKLDSFEKAVDIADGFITSTHSLAEMYGFLREDIFVCRNGIDTKRYDLEFPERDVFNIGWAGGTGHKEALDEWLPAIEQVMRENDNVGFIVIGGDNETAKHTKELFPNRVMHLPFGTIENYPSMLTAFDVSLAPSQDTPWYRAKSDLRWLESSAVGIPVIASGPTYQNVEHELLEYVDNDIESIYQSLNFYVNNPHLAKIDGSDAKIHVQENRDITVTVNDWIAALETVVE